VSIQTLAGIGSGAVLVADIPVGTVLKSVTYSNSGGFVYISTTSTGEFAFRIFIDAAEPTYCLVSIVAQDTAPQTIAIPYLIGP
jgi:hypothetical protein